MICIISNPKPQKALDEQVLLAEETLAKSSKNDELKCESRELNSVFSVLDSIKGLAQFSCKKAATGDFSVALKLLEALSE